MIKHRLRQRLEMEERLSGQHQLQALALRNRLHQLQALALRKNALGEEHM